jgi:hypothetical protein
MSSGVATYLNVQINKTFSINFSPSALGLICDVDKLKAEEMLLLQRSADTAGTSMTSSHPRIDNSS